METSLVIFTVAAQAACGMLLAFYWLERNWLTAPAGEYKEVMQTAALYPLVLSGIAGIGAMTHLGDPAGFYRAIYNPLTSWMSREVLLFSVFGLCALGYAWVWRRGGDQAARRKWATGAAVSAVLFVIASAVLYMMPAEPVWNNVTTVLFFFLTTFLLGPAAAVAVLGIHAGQGGAAAGDVLAEPLGRLYRATLHLTPAVIGLLILVLAGQLFMLRGSAVGEMSLALLWHDFGAAFAVRVALGIVIPLALLVPLRRTAMPAERFGLFSLLFVSLLVGETVGRVLFYATAVHIGATMSLW